jgi:hypothetical protein
MTPEWALNREGQMPRRRGAKWSSIGVQIGCDRGCKNRRNAGFQTKGRGFESRFLHRRVYLSNAPGSVASNVPIGEISAVPMRSGR